MLGGRDAESSRRALAVARGDYPSGSVLIGEAELLLRGEAD